MSDIISLVLFSLREKKKDDLILPFTLISSTQYYSDREYLLTGNFGGIEGGIFSHGSGRLDTVI